ncbi:MAG: FAD-dependent oxidoreductase [Betaproteobacteria bacterium]|nr:FAD-dependent oxidoreductase [Betaproteobacteria bacterium]
MATEQIIVEQLHTAVAGEYDVLVVGGGASGTVAAIAAARAGVNTLLLERGACLGGAATTNLIAQWVAFCHHDTQIVRGIPEELRQRVQRGGGSDGFHRFTMGEAAGTPFKLVTFPFNPEVMKIVLDEAVEEAGVKTLFHVAFSRAIADSGRVRGIVAETVEGRRAFLAGVVVDASGDAAVCSSAGVPCLGEEQEARRLRQPCTLSFRLSNVDVPKFRSVPSAERRRLVLGGLERGELYWQSISFVSTPGDTDAICLMSRIMDIDALSAEDASRAETIGRRQIASIVRFLKREIPGFERAILADIAERVGVRETRRIRGAYMLTEQDIMNEASFYDAIALGAGPMDTHQETGTGITLYAPPSPFEIPLRTLLPVGARGVIACGRNLCSTREALGGARHMATCMALGEAAGNLAAIAARSRRDPSEVPAAEVQERLELSGALYRRSSLERVAVLA